MINNSSHSECKATEGKLRRAEGKFRRAEENSQGRSALLKRPSENPVDIFVYLDMTTFSGLSVYIYIYKIILGMIKLHVLKLIVLLAYD